MKELILPYWNFISFLIPLGIIGIWRWSVWLIKKIIASYYQSPIKENVSGTLAIVTPVYNEDPRIFKEALNSWIKNGYPDEIIAVIDYTDIGAIEIFEKFSKNHDIAKLIITKKPGKRPALADGVKAATSEFVALVDSDTIWSEDIKKMVLSPFFDAQVGGVSTRQDVYQPDALAKRLFQINLSNRYFNDMPFMAAAGDALTCLSGRTAIYRRKAIIGLVDQMVNEKFWGEPVISGDDKTLTRLVQGAGWKTKYIHEAVVYTPGFSKLTSFLQQIVRWSRNSWRSDLQTLSEKWIWKRNKVLALHMIDRFFQPFTLLLSPVYLVVSLIFGHWKIAAGIFIWWMISRPIKIISHLRKHPRDILIVPVYVVFTFVSAAIKVYTLFTLDTQGWITRWDASRLKRGSLLKKSLASVSAMAVIVGYLFGVSVYRKGTLEAATLKSEEKRAGIVNLISKEPRLISSSELEQKRELILNWKAANSYGVYLTRRGDTFLSLREKFNFSPAANLKYENNMSLAKWGWLPAGRKIIVPANELQNTPNVDSLLATQYRRKYPIIFFDKKIDAIRVKNAGSIVTLSKIRRALPVNNNLLEETSPGEWILRSNLYIGKDVTLIIDGREANLLKLKSDSNGNVWIRSQNGNMLFSGTKITSWDEANQSPDMEYSNGRSYITAKGSGRLDVINSDIGYLGYEGAPGRGGPFGGSYGLSWKITSKKFRSDLLTGSVIGSTIHNNYFGIYTFGATGVIIKDNQVFDNIQYGIDPHDDSNNLLIKNNRVYSNGTHGIILSKRCINNEISDNVSYNNRLHGIMLDRNSTNNIVENNTVYGNTDGIAVYDSDFNYIANNQIYQNKQGIRLNQLSSSNYIEDNNIYSNINGLHLYGEASQNYMIENKITQNQLGLSIQNASGNILYGNINPKENKKGGYITVNLNQNEIKL